MNKEWISFLSDFDPEVKSKMDSIMEVIESQRESGIEIFPPIGREFFAFDCIGPSQVKVWIQGQDPYPGVFKIEGREYPFANGLSFSVNEKSTKIPASLKNIFKELVSDLGAQPPVNGDLSGWARQGVLMANAALTVKRGEPGSHMELGWGELMGTVCQALSATRPLVFILWGKKAQAIEARIVDNPGHLILKSAHPSPMGGSCKQFFGTKPFSRTNEHLNRLGLSPINWDSAGTPF